MNIIAPYKLLNGKLPLIRVTFQGLPTSLRIRNEYGITETIP